MHYLSWSSMYIIHLYSEKSKKKVIDSDFALDNGESSLFLDLTE